MKLKTLDLFSGIGGFSLGLESTGFFETIGFVEKDKFCQKVLKKHWSNINIEEDIRNVKGEKYQADVVTGGFPCQPFSVAGKRKSTADDRYLWDEMLRVIRETKPRWVIGENVEGIVNINEGMVLRQVLNDLENEGFQSQCIIIPASGIGAWHQRKRIWILAYSNNNGLYRSQGNATKQSSNEQKDRLSFGDDKDVSNSNVKGLERHRDEYELREAKQEKNFIWSSNDGTKESWWQIKSRICGVPNGVSYELDKDRSNRIKFLYAKPQNIYY
jgi:DNA (cytosine-5)-methyltransferase 1